MNEALKSLVVDAQTSIREALRAIDRSRRQIALVVDSEGVLQATVTDGDVRRGILNGVDLDGPVTQVMHTTPTTVTQGAPDAETRRLLRERKLQHVPVVDAKGRLVDLATGIEEKPTERYFVNGGIYVLSPTALDHVVTGRPLDMPSLLTQIREADQKVGVFPLRDYWRDIGQLDDLEAARSEFDSVFKG